jgi:hypothetical protein
MKPSTIFKPLIFSFLSRALVSGLLALGLATAGLAQVTAGARVNGTVVITPGPGYFDSTKGKGVSASATWFLPNDGVSQFEYQVSAGGGMSANANTNEQAAMRTVLDAVKAGEGTTKDALRAAAAAVRASIDANIVTKPANLPDDPGQFLRNNKGNITAGTHLIADSVGFDNKGNPAMRATAFQSMNTARNQKPLSLGTFINYSNSPVAGSKIALAVNRDPTPVGWSNSTHILSLDLGAMNLAATSAGLGQHAVAMLNLSGAYINGTDDVQQPEAAAISLFKLSVAASASDGAPSSSVLDFFYGGNASDISDSKGHTGLAGVIGELNSQFSTLRSDSSSNYFGFDPDYTVFLTVPGTDATDLLFLNSDAGSVLTVPEPSTAALAIVGVGVCLFRQRRSIRGNREKAA